MKLRVLGCHGGELPKHRTTCFLIDGVLALDAGALTSALSLKELLKVENILVSHSHLDHVKDLPLLVDLLVGRRDHPVVVHASTACARTLRESLFNNELWPDFTRIPTRANPILRIQAFEPTEPFSIGRYRVTPVPVSHPVESCGFVVSDGKASVGMSGDTGPTEQLWATFNATRNLKAVLLETSFPNMLQGLADISGHLTPNTLKVELGKLRRRKGCEVLLYHLKPAFVAQLKHELCELQVPGRVLELGDEFDL
ncbi:MAG TPA: 3',5'-cyclic-nucleotide phosphodiesterase [Myxococcales bacterium]|jgi:cAMP phosphodiesterase|nr:3',5'-cyclic-nucleotide phosphodiesterase [Myxococcales bacterium]